MSDYGIELDASTGVTFQMDSLSEQNITVPPFTLILRLYVTSYDGSILDNSFISLGCLYETLVLITDYEQIVFSAACPLGIIKFNTYGTF